jgi:hypothetical protein
MDPDLIESGRRPWSNVTAGRVTVDSVLGQGAIWSFICLRTARFDRVAHVRLSVDRFE